MSVWRLVFRSLVYHWRINAAVALGVAAATAVLTGALLVGDSVRGSLRRLTLDRLGRIDTVLVAERFFGSELADELAVDPAVQRNFADVAPVILFPRGIATTQGGPHFAQAAQVLVVGCNSRFWELGQARYRPSRQPGPNEVILNAPLAEELSVTVGGQILLRLPKSNEVPADSVMGRKTERVRSISGLTVIEIIPADSLGRFSLQANQTTSSNAYVSLETLQDPLDQDGRVNAILVAGNSAQDVSSPAARQHLTEALKPSLADYGLQLERIRGTFQPPGKETEEVIFDYFHLTTDRMLFSPAAEQAVMRALQDRPVQPVLTYLANLIERTGAGPDARRIPYSLVAALHSTPELGPLLADDGQTPVAVGPDEIALNSWTAEQLDVQPEDQISLTWYEPEAWHGDLPTAQAVFTLKTIVPLTEPSESYRRNRPAEFTQRPTLANDPHFTPVVEGVTDQDTINSWEAPFPVDRKLVKPPDEEYWRNHRTTPKAFVSLATGERLWGSRFGSLTSVRIPAPADLPPGSPAEQVFIGQLETQLLEQLHAQNEQLGFQFLPVKQRGLAASSGATPFDILFLALSFFVIAAALMLVVLLFRLNIEQRASQIGTLLALGFTQRVTARLLVAEGLIVAAAGAGLGVAAGVGYAWLMLAGLRSWWLGAIVTPFLQLHIGRTSLFVGYVSGVVVCAVTIAWSVFRMKHLAVRQLLSGQATDAGQISYRAARPWMHVVSILCLLSSIGLALAATQLGGEAQAGAFVGSGMLILLALMTQIRTYFRSGGRLRPGDPRISLRSLAARNAARNPSRSTMTIGLMAVASFLIVAMSSFRLAPTVSGTGGFELIAESAEPVFADLSTAQGRKQALVDGADLLPDDAVFAFRVQSGDDASCSNLYQATQPRLLGVSEAFIRHFDAPEAPAFAWAASAAETAPARANPWHLLSGPPAADDAAIPVVLDKNMAMYSLHLYQGVGEEFQLTYDDVGTVRFRVVGLLANSVLQGSLLISEADLVRRFPDVSGYRLFLIRTPAGQTAEIAEMLEDRLSDVGFDVASTAERLADYFAVQNTYLSTFQSLGALGLLLGTFGLATVQVRNIVERRRELALMRAAGFRQRRLAAMVLLENTGLLLGGLLTGTVAALVAVLPHLVMAAAASSFRDVGSTLAPLRDLGLMLAVVLTFGILSSLITVRSTLRAPLLPALRHEG
jgi:ABC-type antimicrobial peptide transport system permease subunit